MPVYNRDGYAAHDRQNSRGVDLNRNYPFRWRPLRGTYYSGHKPASERETRIFMRFLDRVDPDLVVSFHQPLNGIDAHGAKRPAFVRRLADELRLPVDPSRRYVQQRAPRGLLRALGGRRPAA